MPFVYCNLKEVLRAAEKDLKHPHREDKILEEWTNENEKEISGKWPCVRERRIKKKAKGTDQELSGKKKNGGKVKMESGFGGLSKDR